jgi:pilus assembly protein Flp/PilA
MKKLSVKNNQKGQGLVEYALILVLVAIVVIAALMVLGPVIGSTFSKINTSMSGIGGGGGSPTSVPTPTGPQNFGTYTTPGSSPASSAINTYCSANPHLGYNLYSGYGVFEASGQSSVPSFTYVSTGTCP